MVRQRSSATEHPNVAALVDDPALLTRLGDLIMEHADELGRLETLDNGKPIFESRQIDVPMVAGCFHYFAGWATKLTGDTIPVNPA